MQPVHLTLHAPRQSGHVTLRGAEDEDDDDEYDEEDDDVEKGDDAGT